MHNICWCSISWFTDTVGVFRRRTTKKSEVACSLCATQFWASPSCRPNFWIGLLEVVASWKKVGVR